MKGINPPGSCLLTLPCYDIVKGTGIDYMHCILLNIVRLLVHLWFDSSLHSQAWSCSKLVSVADERLKSIKPPTVITRAPRSLSERKYWKASEYRSWLFYYSLPIMFGLLPDDYYQHYALLCQAIYTLNSSCITSRDLKFANTLLNQFYYCFPNLYAERYLTFNLHQLLHLTDSVKYLGPLYTFSCFDHEHCNGVLAKMVHSYCGVDKQISYTFSCLQSMCALSAANDVQVEYIHDVPPSHGTHVLGCCEIIPVDATPH